MLMLLIGAFSGQVKPDKDLLVYVGEVLIATIYWLLIVSFSQICIVSDLHNYTSHTVIHYGKRKVPNYALVREFIHKTPIMQPT